MAKTKAKTKNVHGHQALARRLANTVPATDPSGALCERISVSASLTEAASVTYVAPKILKTMFFLRPVLYKLPSRASAFGKHIAGPIPCSALAKMNRTLPE